MKLLPKINLERLRIFVLNLFGLLPLGLFILSSCDSTELSPDTPGNYFIKAKLNDEWVENSLNANFQNDPSRTISATAFKSNTTNFPSLGFTIESSEPITKKKYLETDPGINLIFVYSLTATESYNSQMGEKQDFKIEVTQINKEIVKGKFEGTLKKADQSNNNQIIDVKNGEFYLINKN